MKSKLKELALRELICLNENEKKLLNLLNHTDERGKSILFSLLKEWSFKPEEMYEEQVEQFCSFYKLSNNDPIAIVYNRLIRLNMYEKLMVKLYLNEHIEELKENSIKTIDSSIEIVNVDLDGISKKLIKKYSENK